MLSRWISHFVSVFALCALLVGPAAAADMFGASLFAGHFKAEQFSGFNPNYQIALGDKISVRSWGAVTFEGVFTVDAQGNIFLPNIGPVSVAGVRNGELNALINAETQKVYRSNVGVYATLESAQPVKVFVTGFAKNPGLYAGVSSDSVLFYLDKAGGVDPARGSYIDISVMRDGQVRKQVNLHEFLLSGKLELIQFADGDVIVVGPRKRTVTVAGEVLNSYQFEYEGDQASLAEALRLAQAKPGATHVSVVRRQGSKRTSEYYPIGEVGAVSLQDGDEVSVMADRYQGTILVRVEGAHSGEHAVVVPYGSKMSDVLAKVVPNVRSNLDALQLFRRTLAGRQKEMLLASLQSLESQVLTARSGTNEEATLRAKEAELILKFVERARNVEPKGQIVLSGAEATREMLLEDGDLIRIPERSSVVSVHGEVLFPSAFAFSRDAKPNDYIKMAGGFTQNAETSRVLVLKQNGRFENPEDQRVTVQPGDEVVVLAKVDTKSLEITKAISTIIYQIALGARVFLNL